MRTLPELHQGDNHDFQMLEAANRTAAAAERAAASLKSIRLILMFPFILLYALFVLAPIAYCAYNKIKVGVEIGMYASLTVLIVIGAVALLTVIWDKLTNFKG
jgi:hypothetical protein